MKKPLILIGILIILVAGYATWTKNRALAPSKTDPYEATLSGTIACLTMKDPSPLDTAECNPALKTDQGDYYALDFQLMTMPYPNPVIGRWYSAYGLVTPIENLSTDHWKRYDMKGILSVKGNAKQEAAR